MYSCIILCAYAHADNVCVCVCVCVCHNHFPLPSPLLKHLTACRANKAVILAKARQINSNRSVEGDEEAMD